MSGPFDAAIRILDDKDEYRGDYTDPLNIKAAIRALEAAGKVDKVNCLDYIHHTGAILTLSEVEAYAGKWGIVEQKSEHEIHALLAALPDKVTP